MAIEKTQLNPGDVIVLSIDGHMAQEHLDKLREQCQKAFPDQQMNEPFNFINRIVREVEGKVNDGTRS